jgi:hypothetical protein
MQLQPISDRRKITMGYKSQSFTYPSPKQPLKVKTYPGHGRMVKLIPVKVSRTTCRSTSHHQVVTFLPTEGNLGIIH